MGQGSKSLILLIDDDTDLLETLSDFLLLEGYDVAAASSGEAGLEKLTELTPDLIILDMSMPGMGGVAFLTEVAKTPAAGIPVYVFTARANMEEFFEETAIAGFMAKPCDPEALLTDIRRVIAEGAEKAAGDARAPGAPRRLLLAEDEMGRRSLMIETFMDAGFDVIAVSNGPEVVERGVVEKPDVLVLKLVMEKMNGDVAASRLEEMPGTSDLPIVLYDDTGSVPRDKDLAEGGSGRKRFVRTAKPDDLLAAVKTVIYASS